MRIKHYIQGKKRGKEANRLEREAMSDPFLQDALDGFDSVAGNHTKVLERLEQQILHQSATAKRKLRIVWGAMAATVLLLIGLGSYLFMLNEEKNSPVIATTQSIRQNAKGATDKASERVERTDEIRKKGNDQSSVKFTSPVIKADEEVSEEEDIKTQQEVMQTSAAVGTVDFDKGTDDIAVPVQAQTAETTDRNIIHGKVVDEKGQPLAGVNIQEKGTTKGTITDIEGIFSLKVRNADSSKVTVSYIGYDSKEIKTSPDKEAFIALKEDNKTLNEVAVVGYGVHKKSFSKSKKEEARPTSFGQKEFLKYVRENAKKDLCGEQESLVNIEITLNPEGRPVDIKWKEYSCEKAKLEMARLLNQSPSWTTDFNHKVQLKISW